MYELMYISTLMSVAGVLCNIGSSYKGILLCI